MKRTIRICSIGDPHGDLNKIKKINLKNIDLILLTGDLGSSESIRKMTFENIKRKKQGLPEIKYSPAKKKKAFLESYNSTLKLIRYLLVIVQDLKRGVMKAIEFQNS